MNLRQSIRHIHRRRQIVAVLIRNGLGYLVQRMGLDHLAPLSNRRSITSCEREPDQLLAYKLRQALVELGPTFVKLGQLLSTRPDVLPPIYIEQMERLQDKVRPMAHEDLIRQLSNELGPPEQVFAEFDQNPLAAASIGQVHLARLKSGEQVIVKVQRTDILVNVQNDLEIVIGLARIAERRSETARRVGIVAMVEDYAKSLLHSLDYAREARSTERIYQDFINNDQVKIPKVYWDYCTDKILTEEYINGVKVSDVREIEHRGWERKKISSMGTEAFLTQVMKYGFFTSDPHPGNILVVDADHIAFIDFGEVGVLSGDRLINTGQLLLAISQQDMERALATLRDMGIVGDLANSEDFQEDFAELVQSASSGAIGNLDMNRLRREIMSLAYRYNLKMPAYLTMLMKALIIVEGVGKQLDPDYDFMEAARPLAAEVFRDRLKPRNVYQYMRRKYYHDIKPLGSLPADLHNVIKKAGNGELQVMMQVGFSDKANKKMTQLVSRLSTSLIITGGLIGSSMIISSHPASIQQYAYLGETGFIVALVGLVVFVLSSLRS
ncbi:MAG TPA: lipopolysaccharide core heptose(II) kinase RfaY [Syntrophomonadaceae bacterium]|nr:lipopolysaccharide core heptose(II) kinase RfaY [Syntrophomonadaceae bacterium]